MKNNNKLVVVYVEPDEEGFITIKKDDFEKIMNQAYDAGYQDGYEQKPIISYPNWGDFKSTPYSPNYPKYPDITCSGTTGNINSVANNCTTKIEG